MMSPAFLQHLAQDSDQSLRVQCLANSFVGKANVCM